MATIATAALIITLGVLVWPTPWRYTHLYGHLVRFNRLTAHAAALCEDGWHSMEPNPKDPFVTLGDLRTGQPLDLCLIAPPESWVQH